VSARLAGHLARARELLAEPAAGYSPETGYAVRVGQLEALLAIIAEAAESEPAVRIPGEQIRSTAADSGAQIRHAVTDLAPGSRVSPCPECMSRARRNVCWTGALPSGGDSWRCVSCDSTWTTEAPA
jgi:hypothetical protein